MPLLMLVTMLAIGILNWPISSSGAPAVGAHPPAPLSFEENRGQAPTSAAFVARGRGYRLLLEGPDMLITLNSTSPSAPPAHASWQSSRSAIRWKNCSWEQVESRE